MEQVLADLGNCWLVKQNFRYIKIQHVRMYEVKESPAHIFPSSSVHTREATDNNYDVQQEDLLDNTVLATDITQVL